MSDNKPVIQGGIAIASILSLFEATVVFLKAMSWLHTDDGQTMALLTYGRIVLPILVTGATTWWLTKRTTSLEMPTDTDGTRMVRAGTHEPAIEEQKKIDKAIYERSIQR